MLDKICSYISVIDVFILQLSGPGTDHWQPQFAGQTHFAGYHLEPGELPPVPPLVGAADLGLVSLHQEIVGRRDVLGPGGVWSVHPG